MGRDLVQGVMELIALEVPEQHLLAVADQLVNLGVLYVGHLGRTSETELQNASVHT